MTSIKPEATNNEPEINIYQEYGINDDDSDYDEVDIKNIRPSEIISKDDTNYETNSEDSVFDNYYYQIREISIKDPIFIRNSINNLTKRVKILPDTVKKKFINTEKPLQKKTCYYYFKKILFCKCY